MRRVAVIGGGIAGLTAARGLANEARVTLFEAADRFGGHAHTVDVTLDRRTHGVDIGVVAFNPDAAPRFSALLADLAVPTAPARVTFSAQVGGLEWCSDGVGGVFAQSANLGRPAFWNMLAEIPRFDRHAAAVARAAPGDVDHQDTVGDFLDAHRFSKGFRDWYLMPVLACIWAAPADRLLRLPAASMARFFARHGLLRARRRSTWCSLPGGTQHYVDKLVETVEDARLATPVRQVRRLPVGGAEVSTDRGSERFDAVVFACHSVDALALLADPTHDERDVLGAIHYQRHRAILHTDARVLPRQRGAWAAFNYEAARDGPSDDACVHCLVNRLQPLPFDVPVIVSLNPVREPAAALVQGEFHVAHPLFDRRAVAAQARLPALQGRAATWYCGAWTHLGSHEDGLASAQAVCAGLAAL